MTTLNNTIRKYLKSLGVSGFGKRFDLNQDKSLEDCVSWLANHYLKIKEELDHNSFPTDEAIRAARLFNTNTNTYFASARDDRVIITVVPYVAIKMSEEIGKVNG